MSRERCCHAFFSVCPVLTQSKRLKNVTRPGSGKCIAKSKGVHREVEFSFGSLARRMAALFSLEQQRKRQDMAQGFSRHNQRSVCRAFYRTERR